ncbi:hypothetical protein [Roseovarius sp. ZX-A-9]|uniref:hypothetical protein n=1 Tax=Roseovarius sp. ZX-A-9 TaxID=3014783 RepID=UPI00232F8DD2|nr:hypothetical protein [Roseovarius sp. ZX-A-9]
MAIDATTETIAHFIGHFHISVEEIRLRDQYLEFQANRKAQDALDVLNADPFRVNSAYRLEDYDPKLDYRATSSQATSAVAAPPANAPSLPSKVFNTPTDSFQSQENIGSGLSGGSANVSLTLPLPSSVASITVQLNDLNDDDVVGTGVEQTPAMARSVDTALTSLEDTAESLAGFVVPDTPADEDGWQDFVAEAMSAIRAAEEGGETHPATASVHTTTGAAASGIFIDGNSAVEVPELEDLLPAFLRPEEAVNETDETQSGTSGQATAGQSVDEEIDAGPDDAGPDTNATAPQHDFAEDFGDSVTDLWAVDPGHEVVAGANTQLNEMQLKSSWLDADVIAVQNDAVHLDAISQVNVMATHDVVSGQVASATSNALNVAEIVTSSSVKAKPDVSPLNGLPANSVTVRLETSVTQVNWTQQYNFGTDNDTAEITISGSNTYFGLGENTEYNEAFLTETGFNYDLIMVGGNFIDVTMLTQTNVLLDANWIDGTTDVNLGDNLQYNLARIATTGVDTKAEMTANFSDALDQFAQGAEDVTTAVTHDALFAGTDLLRVLYIEDDFVTVTIAEQTNVLGDVDQVNIVQMAVANAATTAAAASGGAVSVVAGSNAQVNIATVHDFGIDSVVMAGGENYSDALIHQAGFLDPDGMPNGVQMASGISDLVNEAVAFLSDDMMGTHITEATHAAITSTQIDTDTAGQSDVMQTVLA